MNTKYKIGEIVYFIDNNRIFGRPIVEIKINSEGINYWCRQWLKEEDLFVNIDDLLNNLKENADIKG